MMSGIDDILAGYESLRAGQEAFYKELHQHPELSHAEHRTARRVEAPRAQPGTNVRSQADGEPGRRPLLPQRALASGGVPRVRERSVHTLARALRIG
jgi:hypothetical protein